jgi:AcrR family transcriptional regulator
VSAAREGRAGGPVRSPGRPKASEGLDTRADLIKVARELFAAKGYAGTSVSDIGPRAGVSVPLIYQRFGNKAGLFVAVAEDVYEFGITRLEKAIDGIDDFDEAITIVLNEFSGLYALDPSLAGMVVAVLVESERDDALAEDLKPLLRRLRKFADQLAALAPASRAKDDAQRRNLSCALITVLSGLMISSVQTSRPGDYDRLLEGTRSLLLDR